MEEKTSLFRTPHWVAIFAITGAVVWGLAYPLIKLGFPEFGITTDMTGSKMVFAGIRFLLAGSAILLLAKKMHRNFRVRTSSDWWFIILFSLFNTTLHYTFFYIGLSHAPGARSAIINSLSVFVVVVCACLFFKTDKMTYTKAFGCALGIIGILSLNMNGLPFISTSGDEAGTMGEGFTLLGDGFIILNALCSAIASLLTRQLTKRVDVLVGTGYSLALGGLLIIIPGMALGGTLPQITPLGITYLICLILISALGFTLYNKLLTCNPVGKIAIYNSLIPVVGATTSCLFLAETFYFKYIIAATLVTSGVYIVNSQKK